MQRQSLSSSCVAVVLSAVLVGLGPAAAVAEARQAPSPEAASFPGDFADQNQLVVMPGPLYALFNHNSRTWDAKETTRSATLRLNDLMIDYDVPVISSVEAFDLDGNQPVESHFLDRDRITYPVRSGDGSHALLLPNAEVLILSGGYLEYCLRRAIRDLYEGTGVSRAPRPLVLYLVTDAVYVKRALVERAFDRRAEEQARILGDKKTFPLSDAMRFMSDQALAAYLRQPVQAGNGLLAPEGTRVRIVRGDRGIASFGEGHVVISLILLDTPSLAQRLPSIVRSVSD